MMGAAITTSLAVRHTEGVQSWQLDSWWAPVLQTPLTCRQRLHWLLSVASGLPGERRLIKALAGSGRDQEARVTRQCSLRDCGMAQHSVAHCGCS